MLDLFFRKYAWTANLLLLFLGALFTARMVNTLVGALIRPRPRVEIQANANAAPRYVPPVSFDDEKLYHLIGTTKPEEVLADAGPAKPVKPQNCTDPYAQPVRSDLRMNLVAAVLAEMPGQSLASIADPNTREVKVVGVGDPIGSARFLGLERIRAENDITGNAFRMVAVVCNDGTKEYLEAESSNEVAANVPNLGNVPLPPRPVAPSPGGGGGGGGMDGVRSVGPNQYQIDKGVIDSTLGDLNKIAMQARIVPSFENGVANGFKLFSIQPGSLYSAIGIENGDVIQRINGYEINSPDKALELYQKLRESQHVKIDVKRGGQVISKDYTITGP
jgi:general secretion pathway protein C